MSFIFLSWKCEVQFYVKGNKNLHNFMLLVKPKMKFCHETLFWHSFINYDVFWFTFCSWFVKAFFSIKLLIKYKVLEVCKMQI